ncbi:MAG: hypothetical protein ABSG49_02375 [Methanoregula sp.]|uniref:hypothetical protein n=1 Tax=Methanoregula sp. TaxID=2052170 RepID=UPI003C239871
MTLTTAKSDRSSDLEDEKNPPGFFEETFGFFSSSGSFSILRGSGLMTLTTAKSDRSSDLEDEKNPPGFFEETFGFFSSSGSLRTLQRPKR